MFSITNNFTAPPVKITSERKPEYHPRTYSQFVKGLKNNELPAVIVKPSENVAQFQEENGDYGDVRIVQTEQLWQTLMESDAEVLVDTSGPPMSLAETGILLILGIYLFSVLRAIFGSRSSGGMGMPNPFGKSTEFTMDQEVETRFTDVEGIDSAKEELEEIVDFLKKPERYFGSGAKIPRGALLAGAPGTGKTLLARAIAGESNVPFIQCSAANFVEMFVGVGAKRVRELFEQARANQPCIVFIDEIDAVGKKRSAGGMPSNDEREQTINQLLTEMDGFDNETGIVVIAATNRVDILDDALLRPGRFDRKIQVTLPSVQGRRKILGVHARDKTLDDTVDLANIAKQTTGFSGADLANLLNECAIRAVRDGDGIITNDIVENVYQRVVVGAKGDVKFSLRKKELVAYHEAGHAIMGVLVPNYDTVRKVSIIPRGAAGGITFFQPSEENADSAMYTKEYLLSQIKVALGGRAAEEIIYGKDKVTTGASSDYAMVYQIAREMVTTYGLGRYKFDYRNMSSDSAALVDDEIDEIVCECYDDTIQTLKTNMYQLERLKEKLIDEEIVDGDWVYELFGKVRCDEFDCSVSFD
ncbi:MAG: cell division protein FtsH [Dehalococcoidia bacterium]|jgi:cell division protease FtsH|nr:cell division protein FtsH [Dehalococcoidia bacterium]|tara:strand:+ start:1476 stop:3236 length:1761 start_codon:yes stop_codon:yes gene_type:complete